MGKDLERAARGPGGAFQRRISGLLTIDPRRTVVLTVDMQRKYLDMQIGSTPVPPDDAEHVLASTKVLLDRARACGMPVIHAYVKARRIEAERNFIGSPTQRLLSDAGDQRAVPDRFEGSAVAEVPSSLVGPTDVHVTTKSSMDSYLGTDLDHLLEVFRPEAVVIGGINTDTCVYSTAFSTANRGYRPIVISDCVATHRGAEQHRMALEVMSRSFAWVLTLEEFLRRLDAASRGTGEPRRKEESVGAGHRTR